MQENSGHEPDYIIRIENLEKSFVTPSETLHVLRKLNFKLKRGEIIGIMGPSGSGKSTLLNIIGLLDSIDDGEYILGKINTSKLSKKELQQIRLNKIGFIFQTFNLIQTLNVRQNIELPMALLKKTQDEQYRKSTSLLEAFGLSSKAKSFPYQLSIGEQQRVAISRALVNDPILILCDEPTGNLDEENADIILKHLSSLREFNASILIVSHNPAIKKITDSNFILKNGILTKIK